MKNIELTEEHKSKLLEMCKVLFPEDEFTFDNDFGDDGFIDRNFLGENKSNLMWEDDGSHFHWFEFCITEIVNELSWKNIKTDILADCEYEDFRMKLITNIFKDKLTTEKFHIVDYLYEEFKKLK